MNLTKSLKAKGFGRVRYADDAVLFAKSRKAAERLLEWVTDFIEQKLFLKVNAEKTKILRIGDPEVQFLGFSFTSQVSKKRRERYPTYRYFPVVHRKKMLKLKEKLKQITDRRAPGGIERVKRELKLTLRGWVNYFTRLSLQNGSNELINGFIDELGKSIGNNGKGRRNAERSLRGGGRTLRRYMNMLTALTGIGECQRECRFIWL